MPADDDGQEAGQPPPAAAAPGTFDRPTAVPAAAALLDPTLVPSLPSALFAAALAALAYFRLGSLLVLASVLGVSIAYLSEAPSPARPAVGNAGGAPAAAAAASGGDADRSTQQRQPPPAPGHPHEPAFINHALAVLWPMISTDLFTPVLDLLEDTLVGECPPMVHSVRIESLELGKAPCTLKWLRPLTDDEWAEGLHEGGSTGGAGGGKGPGKVADRLLGEDEVAGGDYANFEIAFELDTAGCAPMDKAGILAVFGVGLRGVGGVECPVFIDILRVSGVVRLRLLLDPSPPFVRTGTFTFPALPQIDISAAPLKRHGRGSLNAMKIPGLKPYVLKAMNRVAVGFVSPEAWSMDLDTLLSGEERAIRTKNVGVLQIKLHRAVDLRAADPNGFSDPYVAISWWKQLDRPLFSTRTLLKTLNPVWEETAFLLVPADAIETGEKLVCQVYDSDRFNSDDSLGSVEVDLADIVQRGRDMHADESADVHQLDERDDPLAAPRSKKAGRGQGSLAWAVRFYPLWTLSTSPTQQAAIDSATADDGHVKDLATPEKANIEKGASRNFLQPLFHPPPVLREASGGWLATLARLAEEWVPSRFEWEQERLQRREENVRWLAGKRGIEVAETKVKLSTKRRSGILQWNIVQCQDLQIRPTTGGFEKSTRSKAGGVPALIDVTDPPEGEAPAPVSAYAEVILNDRLVFKTRPKTRQTSPYFNASSERFVRDWTTERLTVVIRDERDREKDAILGVVDFPTLGDVFSQTLSVTRWYPLRGGLGWGIVRMSFLWKAIDIDLPRGISGYDIVSVSIRSIRALELAPSVSSDTLRATSVTFETESDSQTVSGAIADSATDLALQQDDRQSLRSSRSGNSGAKVFAWEMPSPVVLAVKYRLSTFLVVKFFTRSGGLKKKTQVWAIGMLKLGNVPDNELVDIGVPMYSTADVNEAAMLAVTQSEPEAMQRQIGTAFISLRISPGLGRVHQALVKADPHFCAVDEAKQVVAQVELEGSTSKQPVAGARHDRTGSLSSHFSLESSPKGRTTRSPSKSASVAAAVPESSSMDSLGSRERERDSDEDDLSSQEDDLVDGEENGEFYRTRERDPKIFHEGIMSHKAARSSRWAKDKIAGKLSGFSLKHKRQEGASRRVEKEGISSL